LHNFLINDDEEKNNYEEGNLTNENF